MHQALLAMTGLQDIHPVQSPMPSRALCLVYCSITLSVILNKGLHTLLLPFM